MQKSKNPERNDSLRKNLVISKAVIIDPVKFAICLLQHGLVTESA